MTQLILPPKFSRKKPADLVYEVGVEDPKKVVLDALGDALDYFPAIYGNRVLVATAPGPSKYGNIYRPDTKEDRFQGKVGLILKWGPTAFKYDPQFPSYDWTGPKPSVGDWVFYRTSDAWECGINAVSCRIIPDDCIMGRITDVEVIW